jgi:MFS family permease
MTAQETADEDPSGQETTEAQATAKKVRDDAGIWVTWRELSTAAKTLMIGLLVNRLGTFVQIFLVLFMTERRGFTEVQAGTALGLYGAGSVVGVLAGGALADRIGARRTIALSLGGSAPLLLAVLYLDNFGALLVAVTLAGSVSHAYRPAAQAQLSRLTPAHRQVMIFAMQRLMTNLGTTGGPLLGVALIAGSYDLLFWVQAVVSAAVAGFLMVVLPRADRRSTGAAGAAQPDRSSRASGYLAVLTDRWFVLFLVVVFINSAVYLQYLSTLPVAMRAAGLATFWFGVVIALNSVIVMTCELLVTKVVQHWPTRLVVVAGFVLLGGGLAIYALPLGLAVFIAGTLVWTLGEIVAGPTMFAYPAMASPERLRGRYLGSASAAFGVGSAVGPAAGLAVWAMVGSQVWVWYGLVCLVTAVAAWHAVRPRQQPAAANGAVS